MTRSRTYSWFDPAALTAVVRQLGGLVFTRGLAEGQFGPMPMASTIGFRHTAADRGHVEFECTLGEHLFNPMGTIHGGVAATLIDSAAGFAVHSALEEGVGYTTLDMTLHYLRPITLDLGTVTATGTLVNLGRRTALGQGRSPRQQRPTPRSRHQRLHALPHGTGMTAPGNRGRVATAITGPTIKPFVGPLHEVKE